MTPSIFGITPSEENASPLSSMTTANFSLGEYIVMSGLLDVVTISGGNMTGTMSSSHTTFQSSAL